MNTPATHSSPDLIPRAVTRNESGCYTPPAGMYIIITLILICVFLAPWLALVLRAVFPPDPAAVRKAFGYLANRRESVLVLLLRTGAYSVTAASLAMILGVPAGALTARWKIRGSRILTIAFPTAFMFPVAWHAGAWLAWLADYKIGGVRPFGIQISQGEWYASAILAGLWLFPFCAWMTMLAVSRAGNHNGDIDAAAMNLSPPLKTLVSVTLPANRSMLIGTWLVAVILAAGALAPTDLLGVRVFSEEIFVALRMPGAAPAAFSLALLPAAAVTITGWLAFKQFAPDILTGRKRHEIHVMRSRALPVFSGTRTHNIAVTAGVWSLTAILLGAPLIPVFISLRDGALIPFRESLRYAGTAGRAVMVTGIYSMTTAVLSAGTAIPVAVFMRTARRSDPLKKTVLAFLIATLAVPSVVWAAGFISLDDGFVTLTGGRHTLFYEPYRYFRDSLGGLMLLAQASRWTPFSALIIWMTLEKIPDSMFHAAANLGASPFRIFWTVSVAITWRAIVISMALVFALSAGDTGIAYLLQPPGLTPVTVSLLNNLHAGDSTVITGFGIWFLPVALPVAIIVMAMTRRAT